MKARRPNRANIGPQNEAEVVDFQAWKSRRTRAPSSAAAPLGSDGMALALAPVPQSLAERSAHQQIERPVQLRMNVPDRQLIVEALAVNHKQVNCKDTRKGYGRCLQHFSDFLAHHGCTFYTAEREHVLLFDAHLAEAGEHPPTEVVRECKWCRAKGYPAGDSGEGYSASTRKKNMAALTFLYTHFACAKALPTINPTLAVKRPKVITSHKYTPTVEEVQRLHAGAGSRAARLAVHLYYYAPTRREPGANMRWDEVDLQRGVWRLVGKWGKDDEFALHPKLLSMLRDYRVWQEAEAECNAKIASALANIETAYVFLTRNGKRQCPTSIAKMIKWHARRAGVAVIPATSKWGAVNGQTSRMCPHALRRAWGDHAHNDPDNPVPIEVIAEVYRHKETSTTRKHYVRTKPERAVEALLNRSL